MPPGIRRPTIKDVARAAEVSYQTVSRAMNDKPDIDPETKQRVLQIAESLGYRPSRHARALAKPVLNTLGLVVPDLTNPFFPEVIAGVIDAAAEQGWHVIVVTTNEKQPDEAALVRSLASDVDALVGYFQDLGAYELSVDLPLVMLDTEHDEPTASVVEIDVASAVRSGIRHLLARGYRDIGMIDCSTSCDRYRRRQSFLEALAEEGIPAPPDRIEQGEQSVAGGERAASALLERQTLDAIFAFNDLVGVGVVHALHARDLRVPEDCAVLGFDGLQLAELITPPLTTLHIDKRRLGELAVDTVRQLIGKNAEPIRTRLVPELVVRSST